MDINKLYEELGRADADTARARRNWEANASVQRAERRDLDSQQSQVRATLREDHNRKLKRLTVLREAVALAEQGVDPLLAKMTASGEGHEDQHDLLDDLDECGEEDEYLEDDESV
jgi:hypothetical protein